MPGTHQPDGLPPVSGEEVDAAATPSGLRSRLAQYRKLLLLAGAAFVPGLAVGPVAFKSADSRPRLARAALAHVNLSLLRPSLHGSRGPGEDDSLRIADSLRVLDSLRVADSLKAALTPLPEPPAPLFASREIGSGKASYYGNEFAGRRTASGERFDPAELTAAHRTLPFGSLVRVTNTRNGKSVVVRINDRGPFTRSRVIDLSKAAANEIEMVRSGTAPVKLELIEEEVVPVEPVLLADSAQAVGR